MIDYIKDLCLKVKTLIQTTFLLTYKDVCVDDTGTDTEPARTGFFYINGRAQKGFLFSPYGLCSNPPVGSSGLVFNTNAGSNHPVGVVDFPSKRFKNLAEGEVVVGNYITGSYIKFLANGDINLYTTGDIQVTGENIQVVGETVKVEGTSIFLKGNVYGATAADAIIAPNGILAGAGATAKLIDETHVHTGVPTESGLTGVVN